MPFQRNDDADHCHGKRNEEKLVGQHRLMIEIAGIKRGEIEIFAVQALRKQESE